MALADIIPFRRKTRRVSEAEFLVFSEFQELVQTEAQYYSASQGPNPVASDRSRVTGTSYTATGYVTPDGKAFVDLGSSVGGLIPERVPQFSSRFSATQTYEYMTNSDAAVDVSLRAAKMPIMAANFFIQAASQSPEDELVACFIQDNLLGGIMAPMLAVLEDILRMYEHGFSVIEKVYENREWKDPNGGNRKVYTCLKELAPRPSPTIGQVYYDDFGHLDYLDHNAMRANRSIEQVILPKDKILVFTHNKKGGNLYGKSILRTAYKHWYFKDNLYTIDGIQKERHGMGFPVIKLPPNYSPADLAAAKALVKNIRTNEEAGAVLPPGFELIFAEMNGQPVDVMRSVDHHNGMILLNVMLQFLTSGVSDVTSGGRATSGSAQDMYTKSLRYIANFICEIFNIYLIPQLVAYNFQVDSMPQMRVRNVGETKDLQQWASALSNLAARGLITIDEELENWVREVADAPYRSSKTPAIGTYVNMGGGFNTGGQNGKKGDVSSNADAGNAGAPTDSAST